eukprot:204272-Chlamydomonas_euryale.AAC.3
MAALMQRKSAPEVVDLSQLALVARDRSRAMVSLDRKIRVLSVDDDPVNQMVIQSLLPPDKYEIKQAMDGMEALKILDDCPVGTLPDIILLDVMMPGMSGYQVRGVPWREEVGRPCARMGGYQVREVPWREEVGRHARA